MGTAYYNGYYKGTITGTIWVLYGYYNTTFMRYLKLLACLRWPLTFPEAATVALPLHGMWMARVDPPLNYQNLGYSIL